MLIPIGDDDRPNTGPAYFTIILILLNLGVFAWQTQNPEAFYGYMLVPYQITEGVDLANEQPLDARPRSVEEIPQREGPTPIYLTLITSLFLHGGLLHLGSNMLFLWIFGDNVEHSFGHFTFLAFYLISGLVGTAAQVALEPDSLVPMLGASGAISGVLGAYLVLQPMNRVYAIFFFFIVAIPAVVAIGLWVALQVVQVVIMFASPEIPIGGVAYLAHLGGFGAGVVMGFVVRFTRVGKDLDQ